MRISRTIKIDEHTDLTITTELTHDEIYNAYEEQEFNFDYQDIIDEINRRSEEIGGDICGLRRDEITEEMIETMASEKRRQIDKYGVDWEYARDNAIKIVIGQKIEENVA